MRPLPVSRWNATGKRYFFCIPPHHKPTLLFHLKMHSKNEKPNVTASTLGEVTSRELPIDPELRDIILLTNEVLLRFENYWARYDEREVEEDLFELFENVGANLLNAVEDETRILQALMYERFLDRS